MRLLWKQFKKNKGFAIGCIIVVLFILTAVFCNRLVTHDVNQQNVAMQLQPANREYWFGGDHLGRDLFSRIIVGTRMALISGVVISTITVVVGTTTGLIAGYFGGWFDNILNVIISILMSIPGLILATAIVAVIPNPTIYHIMLAFAIIGWSGLARIVRVKVMQIKNMPFIEAAKAFGEKDSAIIFKYIFPNIATTIIIMATFQVPGAILQTTALSFLNIGVSANIPDWGVIMSEAMDNMMVAPWISLYVGAFMVVVIMGLNLFGEGLRDMFDLKYKN